MLQRHDAGAAVAVAVATVVDMGAVVVVSLAPMHWAEARCASGAHSAK